MDTNKGEKRSDWTVRQVLYIIQQRTTWKPRGWRLQGAMDMGTSQQTEPGLVLIPWLALLKTGCSTEISSSHEGSCLALV